VRFVLVAVALLGCSKKTGTASCVELMACYVKCDNLATACTSACDDLGTTAARQANTEVFACITKAGCNDEACMKENCSPQLAACAAAVAAPAAPAAPAAGTKSAPNPGAVPDEEFIFVGANGLSLVPSLEIVAHGVAITYEGTWKESLHKIALDLTGTSYTLTSDSAAMGTGGVTLTETGTWSATDATLVFTPQHVGQSATSHVNGNHETHDELASDPPRTWTVEGVSAQWENFGAVHTLHPAEGLAITGPAPSWSGMQTWTYTLRRAR